MYTLFQLSLGWCLVGLKSSGAQSSGGRSWSPATGATGVSSSAGVSSAPVAGAYSVLPAYPPLFTLFYSRLGCSFVLFSSI